MGTYIREKCLCCECKYYIPPLYPADLSTIYHEKCKKGEVAIKDRIAKGHCKYFKIEEEQNDNKR